MDVRLMPFEHVPAGFEMVLAKGEVCPGSAGGTWGLWFNTTLTDDPAAWDDEIWRINRLQADLDSLTDDQRLIRAQMAGFCRLGSHFPESIEVLCHEIGSGRFSVPWRLGCEGRCLLQALGHEGPEALSEQRRLVLGEYAAALDDWLAGKEPVSPRERKVCGFLGRRDSQEAFVSDLVGVLRVETPSIGCLKELCATQYGESRKSRPFNCCSCEGSGGEEGVAPGCMCSYAMVIDAGLLGAGAVAQGVSLGEWCAEFSRFTQEHVLAYALAVNAWLEDREAGTVPALDAAGFLDAEEAQGIAMRVRAALGERSPAKVWLAACLLKTVASNQRWHKRRELIDAVPEATSWLRGSTCAVE